MNFDINNDDIRCKLLHLRSKTISQQTTRNVKANRKEYVKWPIGHIAHVS